MKLLKPLILISLITSFCFGNEYFNYSINQNLALESIPAKPAQKKATFGIIAAEFGGGLVGWAGGAIIGGLGGFVVAEKIFGLSPNTIPEGYAWSFWVLLGSYIFGSLGSAGGTYIVGNTLHQNGRFLPTLTGSALGLLVLSPFGSVIGYNLSRPKRIKQAFLYQYFEPPSFCFRTEKTKESKIIPVFDFRLVNARF